MAFDETRFPDDISRGATSRQRRLTDVVTLRSGHEERNTIWAHSRRSYDVALGVRDLGDIYAVIEFWEARRGRLRGFRFKDWADFRSRSPRQAVAPTDQAMAMLTATTYQLQKTYTSGPNPYTRTITKPVVGTVRVQDNTGELTSGSDFTVDHTTGVVTFTVPPTGAPTAGFEFDVPVRFEAEDLEVNVALVDVGSCPSIMLVEVRK